MNSLERQMKSDNMPLHRSILIFTFHAFACAFELRLFSMTRDQGSGESEVSERFL